MNLFDLCFLRGQGSLAAVVRSDNAVGTFRLWGSRLTRS
jgi:hypothetical protein